MTIEELLIVTLAQTDAFKELVEKGLVTRRGILSKIAEYRAIYRRILKPTKQ